MASRPGAACPRAVLRRHALPARAAATVSPFPAPLSMAVVLSTAEWQVVALSSSIAAGRVSLALRRWRWLLAIGRRAHAFRWHARGPLLTLPPVLPLVVDGLPCWCWFGSVMRRARCSLERLALAWPSSVRRFRSLHRRGDGPCPLLVLSPAAPPSTSTATRAGAWRRRATPGHRRRFWRVTLPPSVARRDGRSHAGCPRLR